MSRSFGWTSPTTTTDGNGFETEVEIQITVATSLIFFFKTRREDGHGCTSRDRDKKNLPPLYHYIYFFNPPQCLPPNLKHCKTIFENVPLPIP